MPIFNMADNPSLTIPTFSMRLLLYSVITITNLKLVEHTIRRGSLRLRIMSYNFINNKFAE